MKKLASLMALFTLLAGCSSSTQNVKEDFAFSEKGETGLMVIATRLKPNDDCIRPMNTLAMHYRHNSSDADKSSGLLNLQNFLLATDFKDPDGYFYVQELIPGHYNFTNIVYMGTGMMGVNLDGYDFDIQADTINYLGEVTIDITQCGTEFDSTKASIAFNDMRKRDSQLFKERFPKINPELKYQVVGE